MLPFGRCAPAAVPWNEPSIQQWKDGVHLVSGRCETLRLVRCAVRRLGSLLSGLRSNLHGWLRRGRPHPAFRICAPLGLCLLILRLFFWFCDKLPREHIERTLQHFPQYAYRRGASTADALLRAAGHCFGVRMLLKQRRKDHTAKLPGDASVPLVGGLMCGLDLSKAFDALPHSEIHESLLEAGVPNALASVIVQAHVQTAFPGTQACPAHGWGHLLQASASTLPGHHLAHAVVRGLRLMCLEGFVLFFRCSCRRFLGCTRRGSATTRSCEGLAWIRGSSCSVRPNPRARLLLLTIDGPRTSRSRKVSYRVYQRMLNFEENVVSLTSLVRVPKVDAVAVACPVCGVYFDSQAGVQMHIKHQHSEINVRSRLAFRRDLHALHGLPICRFCRLGYMTGVPSRSTSRRVAAPESRRWWLKVLMKRPCSGRSVMQNSLLLPEAPR